MTEIEMCARPATVDGVSQGQDDGGIREQFCDRGNRCIAETSIEGRDLSTNRRWHIARRRIEMSPVPLEIMLQDPSVEIADLLGVAHVDVGMKRHRLVQPGRPTSSRTDSKKCWLHEEHLESRPNRHRRCSIDRPETLSMRKKERMSLHVGRHETVMAHLAANQSRPWAASTTRGTSRAIANSMRSITSLVTGSISASGTSKTSSS